MKRHTTNRAARPEPPPKRRRGRSIHDMVVVDVLARKAMGLAKYGTRLQADNGRDALVDAYQELLDGACYLRQLIEERAASPTPKRHQSHRTGR